MLHRQHAAPARRFYWLFCPFFSQKLRSTVSRHSNGNMHRGIPARTSTSATVRTFIWLRTRYTTRITISTNIYRHSEFLPNGWGTSPTTRWLKRVAPFIHGMNSITIYSICSLKTLKNANSGGPIWRMSKMYVQFAKGQRKWI